MALIVQKYGGSSVGTLERIKHVADKIIDAKRHGHDVVVVVSAMYGETDRLIRLANALTQQPKEREFDVLVSTGEQVSMALLSMALNAKGCPAISLTGHQVGIHTDDVHGNARIKHVDSEVIQAELNRGRVVVVAGFQGISDQGHITTLGRGGSDTTAVAIAIAMQALECQIFTDVDGVYTTDPHTLPEAQMLPIISFEEMLEMASLGAKVLQMRSVELASKFNMPIRVLSTFSDGPGTLVTIEGKIMHQSLVSGIAFSREEAVITLTGIPRRIGIEACILNKISSANIDIDMIAQHATAKNTVDFTFTVQSRHYTKVIELMEDLKGELGDISIKSNPKVAKLSLVGIGMRSHTGVATTMFEALSKAEIGVQMVTTSEIKISIILKEDKLNQAIKVLHKAFNLDKTPTPASLTSIE